MFVLNTQQGTPPNLICHTPEIIITRQTKVDDKSNEITAIPQLLDSLNVSGLIVSIDAMGCQKAIAEKIINKKVDYVVAAE